MKKTVSLILALIMLVSAMPVAAVSAEATPNAINKEVAADRFVETYKAVDKLFRTCYSKNAKGKYIYYQDYTVIRYRVTNKKFKTKKKVMNYLKKYFTAGAAKRIYKEHFKVIKGKQYVYLLLFGYDSALVINGVYASKTKSTSNGEKVTYKLLWTLPDNNFERTTSKQTLVYERGKWVFKYNAFWAGDYYGYETVITPGDGS